MRDFGTNTDLCRSVQREKRKPREIRLFGLARSSNYPVYSIYITYTNAYSCPTPKPPQRRSMSPPSHRLHGNRSNYRRVSGSTDWIQKLCRWRNNIRHTFARVNIELSFLVIPHERRHRLCFTAGKNSFCDARPLKFLPAAPTKPPEISVRIYVFANRRREWIRENRLVSLRFAIIIPRLHCAAHFNPLWINQRLLLITSKSGIAILMLLLRRMVVILIQTSVTYLMFNL